MQLPLPGPHNPLQQTTTMSRPLVRHFFKEGACPRCQMVAQALMVFYAVSYALNPAVDLEFGLQRLPQPGDPEHSCVKLRFRWEACCCNSSWWMGPDCLIEPVPFRGHPPQDVKLFYWVLPLDDFGYCPRCFVILAAHAVWIVQMMHALYGPDYRFSRIGISE